MNLKQGVTVGGVRPEITVAMMVTKGVWDDNGLVFTVTSITDGKHRAGSLHYEGLAFDVRTWVPGRPGVQLPSDVKERIAKELRLALGKEFDVVVEGTHIHIEFDPK